MVLPELSLDILVLVANQVDFEDRSTLLSLCKTCKSLNAIATPLLYSRLDLQLDGKSKRDDMELIQRIVNRGYAKSIMELNIKGDRLPNSNTVKPALQRTSTMEVKAKLSITSLIDPVPSEKGSEIPDPGDPEGSAKVEPLLELVRQCSRLRELTWRSLSYSLETLRVITAIASLNTANLTFRRSNDEIELPDEELKPFAFNHLRNMTSLELLNISGKASDVRSGIIELLFNNPRLKRLVLSTDVNWFTARADVRDTWDDENRGAHLNWFMQLVNDVIARKKRVGRPEILLAELEELHLLEGFNLSEDGDINLNEIIDLSRLRILRYENTMQFEEAYEPPENYTCFRDHATTLEEIRVDGVTDRLLSLIRDLGATRKLKIVSPPDRYDADELERLMDRGLQVECEFWDVALWYKNRKERGGDPYAGFY